MPVINSLTPRLDVRPNVEPDGGPTGRPFGTDRNRPDVQGLRAIAVLAVLVYHLNSEALPGGFVGVDVFLVISGYLITLGLISEFRRTGTLSLTHFWARRILRLIPAATAVLLATAAAVMVGTSQARWVGFGIDFAGAATYSLNWVLARRSVDYLATNAVASPVQHYWSLGVEEQFYLLWPVLILGMIAVARWLTLRMVPLLLGCVTTLFVLSFGIATSRVELGDPSAFFRTTSRIWELAIGAAAAIVVPRFQRAMGASARSVACALGLALIVASALLVNDVRWPGWLALAPTTGAALVLLGGGRARPRGLERVLATRALVWVGGLSYAIYLWHWPLINLAHRRWGDFHITQYVGLTVMSLGLAWLTQRFIEDPIRFSPWMRNGSRRAFALAAMSLAMGLVVSVTLVVFGPRLALVPFNAHPAGASVLPDRIDLAKHPVWSQGVAWALPSAADSAADLPSAYADGCQQSAYSAAPLSCTYGDATSDTVVALAGDSKALQWLPALHTWATSRRIRIITYTKSNCPLADVLVQRPNGQPYPSCKEWYGRVMVELARLHPALIITSQFQRDGLTSQSEVATSLGMVGGLERTWSVLTELGMSVAVIADIPRPASSVSECVIDFDRDLGRCEYARTSAVANSAQPSQFGALKTLSGSVINASGATQSGSNPSLVLIDLTDALCPDLESCPPVVGNVLVYRPGSHITKTYVDSLEARIARLLDTAKLI